MKKLHIALAVASVICLLFSGCALMNGDVFEPNAQEPEAVAPAPQQQPPAAGFHYSQEDILEFMELNDYFFSSVVSLQDPSDIDEAAIIEHMYFYGEWAELFSRRNADEVKEAVARGVVIDGLQVDDKFNIDVCGNDALQERMDRIFGKGHTDVLSTDGAGSNPVLMQLSDDTTAIVGWGYGGAGGSGAPYEIINVEILDDRAVVNAHCMYYYMDDMGDYGSLCDADGSLLKENNLGHQIGDSFERVASANGIDRARLCTVSYIFYDTEDGLRYRGCEVSAAAPSAGSETQSITDAVNDEALTDTSGKETLRTVRANGGLRMRQGPGTNFEKITLIPDGSEVISYAEQDGWYYVRYENHLGWVSGEYCS